MKKRLKKQVQLLLVLMLALLVVGQSYAYPIYAEVSAYSDSGRMANGEWTHYGAIASDDLPFGTKVEINGEIFVVKDRFGGGYTNAIDIYMPSYEDAIEFGRQYLTVHILGS